MEINQLQGGKTVEAREKWLGEYMKGFWQGIKKHEEQAYCQFRSVRFGKAKGLPVGNGCCEDLEKRFG